jgi:hypothetical protein
MSKTCPKCQKVFEDDSITVCPDCNEELTVVEEVKEIRQVSVFSLTSEEAAQGIVEYMKEQGIEGSYQYSLRERNYKIYVAQPDARAALKACTSYYSVEAKRMKAEEDKRRAEEEARRQAEEEARRKAEEEERLRREAEEARIRAEEEARIAAEEEARRQAEEEERARIEAEEAAARAEEEARRKAEEDAIRAAEEAERLQREAEEEVARAEAELRRLEEEEKKRKAEEEARRKAEEEEAKRAASEKRRKSFSERFVMAEEAEQQREESRRILDSIPHVTGETVQDDEPVHHDVDDVTPESGPIFVETEPVDEYAVGDTIVVDAVEVNSTEDNDDFYSSINNDSNVSNETNENYDNFFSGIKKRGSVVEDMFGDNLFGKSQDENDSTKTLNENSDTEEEGPTFEEIINSQVHKTEPSVGDSGSAHSKRDSFAASFAKLDAIGDIDDGTYRGFVPDYHEDNSLDEDELIANKYGFSAQDYKELKERTAKKLHDRKANPPAKPKPENKDFKIIEEDEIDTFRGFVPDYSQSKEEEKMSYYTGRSTIDYSKYRTSSDSSERSGLADLNGTLRSSTQIELSRLFDSATLKNAAKPTDYSDIKSSSYLLALTGGQLNALFTSWLMTNCTSVSVKQFEKANASTDQNYENKIEGVKGLLKQNFGKLDDTVIDLIVRKFYNKYLDE